MSKKDALTTTFFFDRKAMAKAEQGMTVEERARAYRIAELIGAEAGALMGSGIDLLMAAEGREAAEADIRAIIATIDRMRRELQESHGDRRGH